MLLLALLCGCGRPAAGGEDVRTHFETLNGFEADVKILSDLGESTLEYTVHYQYNKEDVDSFSITAPESLSGIGGTIAGEESGAFSLQYDGLSLDDAMPQRTGLTPADGLFCLLCDLRTAEPQQQWTETVSGEKMVVLRYAQETGQIEKQVWLTRDGLRPVCAELYADGERVLTLTLSGYRET